MCGPDPTNEKEDEVQEAQNKIAAPAENKMRTVAVLEPRNRAQRRARSKERMTRNVDGQKLDAETLRAVRKEYARRLKEDQDEQEKLAASTKQSP